MSQIKQTIEISQNGVVSEFVLCRVMTVGRSETEKTPSEFEAKLRDVDVINCGQRQTHDIVCGIPDEYCAFVFDALKSGRCLLAEIDNDWLVSVIEIPDYERIPKKERKK